MASYSPNCPPCLNPPITTPTSLLEAAAETRSPLSRPIRMSQPPKEETPSISLVVSRFYLRCKVSLMTLWLWFLAGLDREWRLHWQPGLEITPLG